MTDDLLTRMRSASSLGAAIKALDEGADEIERLRHDLDRLMDREVGHVHEIDGLRNELRVMRVRYETAMRQVMAPVIEAAALKAPPPIFLCAKCGAALKESP